MNFKPTRQTAIENLNIFIEKNLGEYSKLRNFDFGPDKRSNTSCLSPYITHGVINEKEVISKSLKKFSFSKNEKFIQEVLWRTYWKGWLELRSGVWDDYLLDLKRNKVNGSVRLKLYKGNITIQSRQTSSNAYSMKKVSFEENKTFNKSNVERFINFHKKKLR